tara:strand:- start:3476 stop:4216 length:741 start_codon:yes stop_codon:yes gene_type:complete
MNNNLEKNKLTDLLKRFNIQTSKEYKLLVIMGLLGDFDSIEYAINLSKLIKESKLSEHLDIFIIAIGGDKGKTRFSKFTNFPEKNLRTVENNEVHKLVGASGGLDVGLGGWINMLLMLSGIGSSSTLKEVLRGYTGDKNSNQIYREQDHINLFNLFKFSGKLFQKSFGDGYLRPFELATFRLNNMIEIIQHWKDYISDSRYLPQRTSTFLINDQNEIIYKYLSKDVLSYSKKMNDPMGFLKQNLGK